MSKRAVKKPAGKLSPFNMRTTVELREKIEQAARLSGRSMTSEIEHRVEQSFIWDSIAKDAQTYLATMREKADAILAAAKEQANREAGLSKVHTPHGPEWRKMDGQQFGFIPTEEIVRDLVREEVAKILNKAA